MKSIAHVLLIAAIALPIGAFAETCLTDDGYVVPCPDQPGPGQVRSHFSAGTLPTNVNTPSDIYIIGGGPIQTGSNFEIRANKQPLCYTQGYLTTPIRHCIGMITVPGTYTFDAVQIGNGNFISPYPITLTVQ